MGTHSRTNRSGIFISLCAMQIITHLRFAWHWVIVVGVVFPWLLTLVFVGIDRSGDPRLLIRLFTGNLVLSLLFSTLSKTALAVSLMRQTEALDYLATLPVGRLDLVGSLMAAFLLQGLPSTVILLLLGRYALGLPLVIHPLFWMVLPLAALSMATLGVLIGAISRDVPAARSMAQACLIVLVCGAPVLVPADRYPAAVLLVGQFVPSTYALTGLRETLTGQATHATWQAIAALSVFSTALLALAMRRLQWRDR